MHQVLLLIISIASVHCILNGTAAVQGQFPFLVLMRVNYGLSGAYLCGGALVGSRYVIGSAHCSYGTTTDIVVGQNDISTINSNNVYTVINKVIPTDFGQHFDSDDIGVYELDRDVPLVSGVTEYISYATEELSVGAYGVMVGYGQTSLNTLPTTAHYKELHISEGTACGFSDFYAPYEYCVSQPGVQACFADSGIPVIQYDSSNTPVLVSLLSYGNSNYCGAPGAAQTLSKISAMVSFVQANIPSNQITFVSTPAPGSDSSFVTAAPTTTTTQAPTARPTTTTTTTQRPTTTTTTAPSSPTTTTTTTAAPTTTTTTTQRPTTTTTTVTPTTTTKASGTTTTTASATTAASSTSDPTPVPSTCSPTTSDPTTLATSTTAQATTTTIVTSTTTQRPTTTTTTTAASTTTTSSSTTSTATPTSTTPVSTGANRAGESPASGGVTLLPSLLIYACVFIML